jgi:hypothetical protein
VLGILRRVGVAKRLEARIAGESLFKDGTAVVLIRDGRAMTIPETVLPSAQTRRTRRRTLVANTISIQGK